MNAKKISTRKLTAALLLILFGILLAALSFVPRAALSQGSTFALSGYAWSDTIGWISFNCENTDSCGTSNYALLVDPDGMLSGYAWSDNIGWVSANENDLSGCPSGSCIARLADGTLTGWMKALAGGSPGSGGWDGWISLVGPGYGISHSEGAFSGYAWGSDVVGWVDFSPAVGACTPVYTCSGDTIRYKSSSCQVSSLATCSAPAFCSAGSSVCLHPSVSFTPFTNDDGDYLDGHLVAQPTLVPEGLFTKLYWNVDNVSSCTVSGNGQTWSGTDAGCSGNTCSSGTGGKTTAAIEQQTTFTLICEALPGTTSPPPETAVVNVLPVFNEN